MRANHLGSAILAIGLTLGIVVLLMWPISIGPYSATHGPVTTLRAARSAVLIAWSLSIGARLVTCALRSAIQSVHQSLPGIVLPGAIDAALLAI